MSGLGTAVREALTRVWARRWVYGVPVSTLLLAAAAYVVHLPDTYKASVFVRIKPVSTERVAGALPVGQEARTEQILATARDRVLATPNVAALVPVLWPQGHAEDAYTVQQARGRVSYDQVGEAGFNVSLEDPIATRAATAINRLLEAFLEHERGAKLRSATSRSDFHGRELAGANDAYAKSLADYEIFRRGHGDTMPDLKESTVAQLSRTEAEAREREGRASVARRYLQEWDKLIRQPSAALVPSSTGPGLSAEEQQLGLQLAGQQAAVDKASQQLQELRATHQERWPAVQAGVKELENLKAAVERTKQELEAAHKRAAATAGQHRVADSRGILETLERQRTEFAAEEAQATRAAGELRAQALALERRLAEMPATDLAVRPLKRALEEAERLVKAREASAADARQAAEYYATGDVLDTTGFGVDSWAVPPVSPSGPNRLRWILTAIALGLAIGAAVDWLGRRFGDEAVHTAEGFADLVPAALIVWVPPLGGEHGRTRPRAADFACAIWVVVCLGGAFFLLGAHRGWFPVPEALHAWLGTPS